MATKILVYQSSLRRGHYIIVRRDQQVEVMESVCQKAGEKLDNRECLKQGECSWFRHSQDTYKLHGVGDNLPPGFIEE